MLMESTRRSIEKWAEEFARELREDPVWREEIKREAKRAATVIGESLRILHDREDAEDAAVQPDVLAPRELGMHP